MNLSGAAKVAALSAALTPACAPITDREIHENISPPAVSRSVGLEENGVTEALTFVDQETAAQAPQDPVKAAPTTTPPAAQPQDTKKAEEKKAESPATPPAQEAPKVEEKKAEEKKAEEKKAETQPAPDAPKAEEKKAEAAPAVQAAQDPKKEPAPTVERTPEQMQEISAQIRALDLVHKEIYQKLAAGVPIERVLQEADARLRTMSQANQQSLTTLEEALKDPSRLEAAQQMSRATIDARVAKYFQERISKLGRSGDLGEATGYCASLEGAQGGKIRSYPELRGAVEAAKDRVRTQLGIRVEPSGQLVDTLPKIYDTDSKLHSALSISSATVKPSVPLTAEEAKVVMAKDQPIDEKSVAKIKEAKALHDAKLEEIRTSNPEAFKRLDELEGRALELAKQSQIMEARKIVPGVDYRPENVRVLGKLSESTIAREHAELKAASDAVVRDECAALKAQWPAKERHSRRDR